MLSYYTSEKTASLDSVVPLSKELLLKPSVVFSVVVVMPCRLVDGSV